MWTNIILLILLFICVITDLRERRIYNKVLLPFFLISITSHSISGGFNGFSMSLLGTIVGLLILLIPYLMGGMGAGDVKLLAVIGAIKGVSFVLMTALFMALAGGVIGLTILLFRRGVFNRMKQIVLFFSCLKQGLRTPFFLDKEALSTTYPYGVAIAIGAVVAIVESSGRFFL